MVTLNFIGRYHAIIVLLTSESVFHLEKNVLSCVIFHLNLLYLHDFQTYKYQLTYRILFLLLDFFYF